VRSQKSQFLPQTFLFGTLYGSVRTNYRHWNVKLLIFPTQNFSELKFINGMLVPNFFDLYTANRKPASAMQLRLRGHSFALPTIYLEFNKRHFVARVLFDYV